jgi:hypothetical protein
MSHVLKIPEPQVLHWLHPMGGDDEVEEAVEERAEESDADE